jgi:hypothetical protein
MHRVEDGLSLLVHIANCEDNMIFLRAGSLNAPYCAWSLRTKEENVDFISWGSTRWMIFDSPTEYVEHCADSEYSRSLYWRNFCCGCGRKILHHEGPGKMEPK